ncbi:MAG: hypothetical protein AB203_04475 [Parcubacteria bacterium C7867-008]|nr:MAG: hypothetical protein AB203_04475 [Parcubacteria bacterium C7867-008]
MVTARDLRKDEHGKVVVGFDTARVCSSAAKRFKTCDVRGTKAVVVTAGKSEDFGVVMGADIMRRHVNRYCYIDHNQIYSPVAEDFDTNGEMTALARFMRDHLQQSPEDTFEVYVAASWWHAPRAGRLLKVRLDPNLRERTTIRRIFAPSFSIFSWRLWYNVAGEYIGAWPKSIRNRNVFA